MAATATASRNGRAAARTRKAPAARAQSASKSVAPVQTESQSENPVKDFLDSYKFEYELIQLDLASINRKESERNQARIDAPVNEDVVVLYAEQMRDGAKFPPIVVHKQGDKYVVMDGNHRVAAADLADLASMPAYVVVNASSAAIRAFTYEANTRHGLPTSLQDRLRQAVLLIETGSKAVDVSRQLGLPLSKVRDAWDSHEATKRFDGLGVRRFDKISLTSRRKLSVLYLDSSLKAAAELVLDAGLGGDDVNRLVRDVNAVRTEKGQLDVIKQHRESRAASIKATAGGRVPAPQTLVTLARATGIVNRLPSGRLTADLESVSPEARAEYAKSASEAVENLMVIIRDIRRMAEGASA